MISRRCSLAEVAIPSSRVSGTTALQSRFDLFMTEGHRDPLKYCFGRFSKVIRAFAPRATGQMYLVGKENVSLRAHNTTTGRVAPSGQQGRNTLAYNRWRGDYLNRGMVLSIFDTGF